MADTTILLIDDDQDIIDSLRLILENERYRVVSASSKQEGMGKIKQEKPALVILDVMMEGYSDGFEMARDIKADPELKAISILMLTSVQDKTGVDFSQGVGDPTWMPVDAFIEKPADPALLVSEVKRLLGAGR